MHKKERKKFVKKIKQWVHKFYRKNYNNFDEYKRPHFEALLTMLRFDLKNIDDMLLSLNKEKGLLIDSFSTFYTHVVSKFKESTHYFDNEMEIEEKFKDVERYADEEKSKHFDFKFIDSTESQCIQLSDIISGTFAKYFDFLSTYTIEDMYNIKNNLNPNQKDTLSLIKKAVEKSDNENKELLQNITSAYDMMKHGTFMFDQSWE